MVLSPSNAITKDYAMVPMTVSKDGTAQWPRGCVNVGDKMTFCAPLVFATGSTGMIRVEMDKAPNWTGDGDVGSVLDQGNYETAIGSGSMGTPLREGASHDRQGETGREPDRSRFDGDAEYRRAVRLPERRSSVCMQQQESERFAP